MLDEVARRGSRRVRLVMMIIIGAACAGYPAETLADPIVRSHLQVLVDKHLKLDPDYMPGDLLTRGRIESIFNELVDVGVVLVDDSEELYDVFLPDGGFLAQFSRTPAGRDFLRQVAHQPKAYDRIERLSWLPLGQKWLKDLASSKEGPAIFQEMTTDAGLKIMESRLSGDARGRNLRLPTGHIRTEKELLVRLERVVQAAVDKQRTKKPEAIAADR